MTCAIFTAIVLCGAAFGQAVPAFEAASVKEAPPVDAAGFKIGCSGGPGTVTPNIYNCYNADLETLIAAAFDIKRYQIPSARPTGDRYNVLTRVPAGATKDQVKLMLQNLLAERFGLVWHYAGKEVPVYELTVAKSGLKMRESPADGDAAPAASSGKDENGFAIPPRLPAACTASVKMSGLTRLDCFSFTVDALADKLAQQALGRPVTNATGLKAKYDMTMTFLAPNMPPPPATADPVGGLSIFDAVQKYLGLKLESGKGIIDEFIIDHVLRTPTEN